MVKCPNCPHPVKGTHNLYTGKCKMCRCEGPNGSVKGGYASDLARSAPTRFTKEEVQRAARAPVVCRRVEPPPHKVGDIGSELSREFKRLTKGGKP